VMLVIVFSKDRACQLELLLRSLKEQCPGWRDWSVQVLYTASTGAFEAGYRQVMGAHPEIGYTRETVFKDDLVTVVREHPASEYVMFLVDDLVFKNPFPVSSEESAYFEANGDVLCLSLRMGPHLVRCYPRGNRPAAVPAFDHRTLCVWQWPGCEGDWGYPMSLDGHVYRRMLVETYLKHLPFTNPNTLEGLMSSNVPRQIPRMICFRESIVMNLPLNRVQNTIENIHGSVSAESLNNVFLEGKQISLAPLRGFRNRSAHEEVPITFEPSPL
jgi:hypothetical protein